MSDAQMKINTNAIRPVCSWCKAKLLPEPVQEKGKPRVLSRHNINSNGCPFSHSLEFFLLKEACMNMSEST
jgi:hypothetical protein